MTVILPARIGVVYVCSGPYVRRSKVVVYIRSIPCERSDFGAPVLTPMYSPLMRPVQHPPKSNSLFPYAQSPVIPRTGVNTGPCVGSASGVGLNGVPRAILVSLAWTPASKMATLVASISGRVRVLVGSGLCTATSVSSVGVAACS
jgi:hypothetical protein